MVQTLVDCAVDEGESGQIVLRDNCIQRHVLHNNRENVFSYQSIRMQPIQTPAINPDYHTIFGIYYQAMMRQSGCEGLPTGVDRRVSLCAKMNQYPYNSLLYLRSRNSFEQKAGTAFLIHPQYALTAAHNFYGARFDYLSRAEVYPAAVCDLLSSSLIDHNKKAKINKIHVSHIKIPHYYRQNAQNVRERFLFDYALIKLERPVEGDVCLKPFSGEIEDVGGQLVEICGYSKYAKEEKIGVGKEQSEYIQKEVDGYSFFNPVTHRQKIFSIQNGLIKHGVDTDKGQSGSPMILDIKGKKTVIGIHFYYHRMDKYGRGIYLNHERFQAIQNWVDELEKPSIRVLELTKENVLKSTSIQSIMKRRSSSLDEKSEEEMKKEREEFLQQEEDKMQKEKQLHKKLEDAQKDLAVSETKQITCFDMPNLFFRFNWQRSKDFEIEGKKVKKITKTPFSYIASYEWVSFKKRNIIKVVFHKNQGTIWVGLLSRHVLDQMKTNPKIIQEAGRRSLLAFQNSTDLFPYGRIYSFDEMKTNADEKLFADPASYVGFDINSECGTITLYVDAQPKIEIYDYDIFVKDEDIYLCVVMTNFEDEVSINQS